MALGALPAGLEARLFPGPWPLRPCASKGGWEVDVMAQVGNW